MATVTNYRQNTRIAALVETLIADPDFTWIQVRGRLNRENCPNHVREIRSKKHRFDVIGFDVLGNCTVLDHLGNVRQLIGAEITAAGIPS